MLMPLILIMGQNNLFQNFKPDLSGFVYSTTFGTASNLPNISPTAFLVDRCENVYVAGWGGCFNCTSPPLSSYPNAGTGGMPVTPDAVNPGKAPPMEKIFISLF